jgi:hypothetical protein
MGYRRRLTVAVAVASLAWAAAAFAAGQWYQISAPLAGCPKGAHASMFVPRGSGTTTFYTSNYGSTSASYYCGSAEGCWWWVIVTPKPGYVLNFTRHELKWYATGLGELQQPYYYDVGCLE